MATARTSPHPFYTFMGVNQAPLRPVGLGAANVSTTQKGFDDFSRVQVFLYPSFFGFIINHKSFVVSSENIKIDLYIPFFERGSDGAHFVADGGKPPKSNSILRLVFDAK